MLANVPDPLQVLENLSFPSSRLKELNYGDIFYSLSSEYGRMEILH